MGTRSLTRVFDGKRQIINLYRQFDGYPTGHGAELFNFLEGKPVVNGYQSEKQVAFNGAGCLAAQLVSNFKKGIGGFYLYPISSKDIGEEYEYHVIVTDAGNLRIKVIAYRETVFSGSVNDFGAFCAKKEEAEQS